MDNLHQMTRLKEYIAFEIFLFVVNKKVLKKYDIFLNLLKIKGT
jgi:hypothetical protein